jgi:hypothetical protein
MTDPTHENAGHLEELGFYHDGRPSEGMLRGDDLREARRRGHSASQIDRSFKYDAVLQVDKLGVTEIFELDGSPCIYFKTVGSEPTPEQLAHWHRAAWNHGLARMLWVTTPTHIRIFNAYSPPREHGATAHDPDVELFAEVAHDLEKLQTQLLTREAITSGAFWEGPIGRRIDRATRIDEQLVHDLTLAASQLAGRGMDALTAHRLLLRTIFIAYLEAKTILPALLFDGLGAGRFEDVLEDVEATRTFFTRMREVFNGDLFPPPPQEEGLLDVEVTLTEEQLAIPRCILARTDLTSFQQSLNFWRYDFDVIPIELISSIYEQFIHAADPVKAHGAGTHYTPVNLVDLVLSQVFDDALFEGKELPEHAKILDLSCGSGVFLVECFRRLVARRIARGEAHTRELIRQTLYDQIFGVDVEATAVEIAAFSLCLTAFELDPEPNATDELKFKQQLKGRNLFVADAFDPEASFAHLPPFEDGQFSIVVGNPPWTRQKGARAGRPTGTPSHVTYCKQRVPEAILPYRNPPDQAFVWRGSDFSRPNARFGFILEGKRFFSQEDQSIAAKRGLLTSFTPRVVVNLSALHREKLFPSAEQPAVAVVLENLPAAADDSFLYVTVERDLNYREHGLLRVGPENIHRISVGVVSSNEHALKIASWGNARDMALVERLRGEFLNLEELLAGVQLKMFQGYIRGDRSRPVSKELHGLPCLTGGGLQPFSLETLGLPPFEEEYLQWPRDPAIYRGPVLIAGSGLRGNRLVASICLNDVVYSRSFYGIPQGQTDPTVARYLSGIINSSMATYFVFLTATNWGIEKYELLPNDYLRIPIPDVAKSDQHIVKRLLAAEERLRLGKGGREAHEGISELDEAVFELYGLESWERVLVEDMLNLTIDYQRMHGKSTAVKAPLSSECLEYADSVIGVIQPFLAASRRRSLSAEVYEVDGPLRVVKFQFKPGDSADSTLKVVSRKDLSSLLQSIAANLDNELSAQLYTRRHLRLYSGDTFFVVKPAQRRFWSRSAGLVDADSVLKDFVGTDRG